MSTGTGTFSWRGLKPRWSAGWRPAAWRPVWSQAAALRALRTTLVMPGLFALTFKGFGNLQMALFAGFGSFATLVLVSFAGTARDKLLAHLGLALAGSVLLVIGTAVSPTTAVAAIVTVPVAFLVFFAGVAGPNAASAVTGALLAYVLPAASPGTVGMIPDRLAGWWLASAVGTVAVLALPTPSAGDRVRRGVEKLAARLADAIEAALRGESAEAPVAAAIEAKRELRATFSATPFRPTGLAIRDQALANAVELLEWCTALVADTLREQPDLGRAQQHERDLLAASLAVLRDSGALFADRSARPPDLDGLDARQKAVLAVARSGWHERPGSSEDARISFHAHTIATTVLVIGADALLAAKRADPEQLIATRARWFGDEDFARAGGLAGLRKYLGRHASVRSVWFINSMRGALALAAAVTVADVSSVQHGFWVVLGTLSVLRTNASATGATALRALLGTALGFVVGGALLVAIGTSNTALWIALPVAVLVASYAPGTAPFAVGQAAFTITVAVLFNLLVPVGWKVGELRVEDVAIGCLVSVLVGTLFWPRGVAPLVGDDLADAYRAGAAYLREAIAWVRGRRTEAPTSGPAALTAGVRLDEAVRGFLAEQGTKHLEREELWRLIGGTLRLRLTAHAVASLPHACAQADPEPLDAVQARADGLVAWYEQLALQVGRPRPDQPQSAASRPSGDQLPGGGHHSSRAAIWLREHLDHLAEHIEDLTAPAARLAEIRRQPWWR
ncbi:MAG: FUSC family protein [Solirubrobacterales bacterium]|nr:FUSC family protein [Solirubrobacterales bacterium]